MIQKLLIYSIENTLKSGLNIAISSNFFVHGSIIYEESYEARMGFSISDLLAKFKFSPFESKIFSFFRVVPLVLLRYVEDICIVQPINIQDFMVFIQQVNGLDINIKFTFELETEGRLLFLDVNENRE